MPWISPENIATLLKKEILRMNWNDFYTLYNLHVKCRPLWCNEKLTYKKQKELKTTDVIRTDLHTKITHEVIENNRNKLPYMNYDDVRRGIALLIEKDYEEE